MYPNSNSAMRLAYYDDQLPIPTLSDNFAYDSAEMGMENDDEAKSFSTLSKYTLCS